MSYITFVYRNRHTGNHLAFDENDPALKNFTASEEYDDFEHVSTLNHVVVLQRLYDAIGGIFESK